MKKYTGKAWMMVALAATLTFSCQKAKQDTEQVAEVVTELEGEMIVPYKKLTTYYLKRKTTLPDNGKITSKNVFDRYISMSELVNDDGESMLVDFDQQFVIAVTKPSNEDGMQIADVRLLDNGTTLTLEYCMEQKFELVGMKHLPLLVVAVDRQYVDRKVEVKEIAGD